MTDIIPKGVIILHLLADLETQFVPKLLRKLDGDCSLIFEAFGTSKKLIDGLDDWKTPLTDSFLDGLSLSNVGNVIYQKDNSGDNNHHHILLNISPQGRRGNASDILGDIKILVAELREKIVENLRHNIKDEMQSGTIVEFSLI